MAVGWTRRPFDAQLLINVHYQQTRNMSNSDTHRHTHTPFPHRPLPLRYTPLTTSPPVARQHGLRSMWTPTCLQASAL